jgi:autotransporter-associated beta strand protein
MNRSRLRSPFYGPSRAAAPKGRFICSAIRLMRESLAAAVFSTVWCSCASAGTSGTWTNTASGGLWSNASNWSGGVVADGADSIADFSTLDITADDTVHLDSSRTIGSLVFGDTNPSNNWTLDDNGSSSNKLTLAVSSGSPSVQVNDRVATISSRLGGNQGFTKAGSGTLVLAGVGLSGFRGVATISSGTLQIGNGSALSGDTVAVNVDGGLAFSSSIGTFAIGALSGSKGFALTDVSGAAVQLQVGAGGGSNSTYSGVLTGAGSLNCVGISTLTLAGANTFSGTTAINSQNGGSVIQLANANALQNSTALSNPLFSTTSFGLKFSPSIGTFNLGGLATTTNTLNTPPLSLTDTNGNPITLQVGSNNLSTTFRGILTGAGSLIKVGTGTLTLNAVSSSASPFSGVTTISGGAVQLTDQVSLQNSLVNCLTPNGLTFAYAVPAIGGLSGPGNISLTDSFGNPVTLLIGLNNGATTYSGVMSGLGSLDAAGGGVLTLSNANTYQGSTTVASGTLSVTGSLASNGSKKVFESAGTDFRSTLTASIARRIQAAATFAGLGSTSSGHTAGLIGTSVDIRAGKDTGTLPIDLAMQWRVRNGSDGTRVLSDILNITGMSAGAGTHVKTDPFALQMSYSPAALGGVESTLAAEGLLVLGWLDTTMNQPFGLWENATMANFGSGLPGDVFANVQSSWDAFASANAITDANVGNFLGSYGVDVAHHQVWAVVNHNGQFAALPEPASWELLAAALALVGGLRAIGERPRRRSSADSAD